jgi:hypothetical protein
MKKRFFKKLLKSHCPAVQKANYRYSDDVKADEVPFQLEKLPYPS